MVPRRLKDVGKPKAEVAAQRVQSRVTGVQVTPHFCRIEEKPIEFYEQFHVIILGLDSLEARRYMNQVVCSLLGECVITGVFTSVATCCSKCVWQKLTKSAMASLAMHGLLGACPLLGIGKQRYGSPLWHDYTNSVKQ